MEDACSPPEITEPRQVGMLTDQEILGIYHDAQEEAQMEADWRGIAEFPTARSGRTGNTPEPFSLEWDSPIRQNHTVTQSAPEIKPGCCVRGCTRQDSGDPIVQVEIDTLMDQALALSPAAVVAFDDLVQSDRMGSNLSVGSSPPLLDAGSEIT